MESVKQNEQVQHKCYVIYKEACSMRSPLSVAACYYLYDAKTRFQQVNIIYMYVLQLRCCRGILNTLRILYLMKDNCP